MELPLQSGFWVYVTSEQLIALFLAVVSYALIRCVYHLYFHPAARFPGPTIAAISNVWYAYHWLTGKYAMAIEKAFEEYGDVVRIAPNEVAFITLKAASDIYASHTKNQEHFTKTVFVDTGDKYRGVVWETDPTKHRQMAKMIAPTFSMKSIKAKEPIMHTYIDKFVQKMKEFGNEDAGIELKKWADWLVMDISAELAYSRKMNQMEDMKSAPLLEVLWRANYFLMAHQICKKFPLLSPIQFLFVSPSAVLNEIRARKLTTKELEIRIERRGKTTHVDHFDHLLPVGAPMPTAEEKKQLNMNALQMLLGGWEQISSECLGTIMFSLQEHETYKRLVTEVRENFTRYEDITPEALAPLNYLNGALMETLRFMALGTGLPRLSPGAMVDGNYVAKGVCVQYGHFAFTRSPRYFHDPRSYKPERWLPESHPYWEPAFKSDARESFFPFNQGPRVCPGSTLAWHEMRLIIANVLWTFVLRSRD